MGSATMGRANQLNSEPILMRNSFMIGMDVSQKLLNVSFETLTLGLICCDKFATSVLVALRLVM